MSEQNGTANGAGSPGPRDVRMELQGGSGVNGANIPNKENAPGANEPKCNVPTMANVSMNVPMNSVINTAQIPQNTSPGLARYQVLQSPSGLGQRGLGLSGETVSIPMRGQNQVPIWIQGPGGVLSQYGLPHYVGASAQPQFVVLQPPTRVPASPPPPPPPAPKPVAEEERGGGEGESESRGSQDLVDEGSGLGTSEEGIDKNSSEKMMKSLFRKDVSLDLKLRICGSLHYEHVAEALLRRDLPKEVRAKLMEKYSDSEESGEEEPVENLRYKDRIRMVFELIGEDLSEVDIYKSELGDPRGFKGREKRRLEKKVRFPTSNTLNHHFLQSLGGLTGLHKDQTMPTVLENLTPFQRGVKEGKRLSCFNNGKKLSMVSYQIDDKRSPGWPMDKLELDSDLDSVLSRKKSEGSKTGDLDFFMEQNGDMLKILNQMTFLAKAQTVLVERLENSEGKSEAELDRDWDKFKVISQSRAMALEDLIGVSTNLMLNMVVAKRESVLKDIDLDEREKSVLRLMSPLDKDPKHRVFGGQLDKFATLKKESQDKLLSGAIISLAASKLGNKSFAKRGGDPQGGSSSKKPKLIDQGGGELPGAQVLKQETLFW